VDKIVKWVKWFNIKDLGTRILYKHCEVGRTREVNTEFRRLTLNALTVILLFCWSCQLSWKLAITLHWLRNVNIISYKNPVSKFWEKIGFSGASSIWTNDTSNESAWRAESEYITCIGCKQRLKVVIND